ncbi:hypothetical protein G9A89_000108 [Geosiphon pyriformis]|nr:hypothetical protein G9A89_000108 [Geosiphon pyriformis]
MPKVGCFNSEGLKLKSGLPLDFSNNVLYHSSFYGLKTFEQILSWCSVHSLYSPVCINVNSLNNFLVDVVWVFLDSSLFLGVFLFFIIIELPLLSSFGAGMVLSLIGRLSSSERDLTHVHLHDSGSLDASSSSLNDAVVKNILKFHEFRLVCDQLSGIGASGFSVYMNGFFCSLGSVDMKAGTAAFFKNINLGLGVEVSGMVFSILVELQVIVLAFENLNIGWHKAGSFLPGSRNVLFWLMAVLFLETLDTLFMIFFSLFIMHAGKLPVAIRKHFYDKHYPSVMCLYYGDVKILDHVFSYVFDAAAQFQLFVDFVSA